MDDPRPARPASAHWYDPRDWPRLIAWEWRLAKWKWRTPTPPTAYERRGLHFWGVVLALTLALELAAAVWSDSIGWPTISSTVGHLEDRWTVVGVFVVALLTMSVFYLLAWRTQETGEPPLGLTPLKIRGIHYRPWSVLAAIALVFAAVLGFRAVAGHSLDKYVVGYALYGSIALFGIVLPLVLRHVGTTADFPNLFATLEVVRLRFRVVALVVLCGLAVLAVHLAFYPWPDLARDNVKYAGYTLSDARANAEAKLQELGTGGKFRFAYGVRGRGAAGRDVWFVYFNNADFTHDGPSACVVQTRKPNAKALLPGDDEIVVASPACR